MSKKHSEKNPFLHLTRNTLNRATFRTNQYKQVVQKKIDLGNLQKKIEQLHAELGKTVADQYLAGQRDLLNSKEITRILEKISSLDQAEKLLEKEIEQIRAEQPEQISPTSKDV